ncbi:MAG: hypothetical protein IKK26_02905 [Clostridia bacterium]|nr:hypothetical protein [Clostridia bacterium]
MTNGGNYDGLPEIIKKLTESPEIADIIKNAGLSKTEDETVPKAEDSSENFGLSPEMMAKLPSVISMLQGMGIGSVQSANQTSGESTQKTPSVDMNEIASRLPQAMSALSSVGIGNKIHKGTGEDKKRQALLKALRPYMNERKRGAIDAMLGFGSLAEIIMMLTGGEN